MEQSILEKFTPSKDNLIKYLPNWADDNFITGKLDINKYLSLIPDGFKIMFAGNIGTGQDFHQLLK